MMHTAVAGDDNDLSVSLLSSGWYTLRTHCDTLRKSRRAVVAVCARSAASRRRALAKLGAAAASATEQESAPDNLMPSAPTPRAYSMALQTLPTSLKRTNKAEDSLSDERCGSGASSRYQAWQSSPLFFSA